MATSTDAPLVKTEQLDGALDNDTSIKSSLSEPQLKYKSWRYASRRLVLIIVELGLD